MMLSYSASSSTSDSTADIFYEVFPCIAARKIVDTL